MKIKDYYQMMNYLTRKKDPKKPTLKDRPVRKPGAVPPKTNTIKIDPPKTKKVEKPIIDIALFSRDLGRMDELINSPKPQYKPPKQEKLEGIENVLGIKAPK